MKRTLCILFLALLIGVFSGATVSPQDTGGCFERADVSMREEILDEVNRERQKNDLSPVTCDAGLSLIAQNHAEDMSKEGYFSHTGPDGKDAFDYLTEAGISYRCAAENIAWGDDNAKTLVKRWMRSTGHRQNILGDFSKAGIGSYDRYYVLVLIRE
jgi:uncharacterized protein YkwD